MSALVIDFDQFYIQIKPWPNHVKLMPWHADYPDEQQPMLDHGIGK